MPCAKHLQVKHAEERVAAEDAGVEEAERLAGFDGFDPQRHLGEFDGHRIAVHAVDAGAHHIAQSMAIVLGGRDAAGPRAGDARGNPPRGGQQEVAGAAGGIDDGDAEQSLDLVVRLGFHAIQHRVEGAIEQRLHQAIGRVIAAGGLALVALGFVALGEAEAAALIHQDRREFEEAFVDGAEFFGLHVAPVDGDEARVVLEPGQAVDGFHERAIRKARAFEIGNDVVEQAAERGKRELRLALGEAGEGDEQPFPAVVVLVPSGAANGAFAERAERVAFGVELGGARRRIGRMQ